MEKRYNDSQVKAIHHFKGPCLTLAGPGSGKTAVLTERTRYLIRERGVDPAQILVITFTKAAAMEMKERFLKLMGEEHCPVTFGTFHAVYFSILKHAYHYNASNIIREEQKYAFMRELVQKKQLEYEDEAEFITSILGEISTVKNTGVSIEHYYSTNCAEDIFRKLYQEYQSYLYGQRLIDFDDMLVYTYELFRERQDILGAWQRKFRYILIDEFQDINKIQFDVIKMLAKPENNLFVVGDDDQSIYRFRGARPEIMLHFRDDYPDAVQLLLDTNYRSQKEIVDASLCLIDHNRERFPKNIQAAVPAESAVDCQIFKNQREEIERIIWEIRTKVERGARYEDFAVLFRTNTQPQLLTEKLMEYNIPFRMKDRIPNLYEHWVAKDICTYLRIAGGSRYRKDFLQIMNRPKRYISRDSLDSEIVSFDVWEWAFEEKPWVAERIRKLEADIEILSGLSPYAAINYIRKGIGYDEFCEEYADYRRMNVDDLYEILDELMDSAKGYRTAEEWFDHMEAYTKELEKLFTEQNANQESVALATLHASKGLEYREVYIIDVNEGIMPYRKAVLDNEIEEERRMFYVGMTRAKKYLHLYAVKQINHKDADISRFILESKGQKTD